MEAKCYRAMQRAQIKMLREYFSGVPAGTGFHNGFSIAPSAEEIEH